MRRLWIAFAAVMVVSFAIAVRVLGLNGGLLAMCLLSLLPVGLFQTYASAETGYWYARSPEFMQTDLMQTLRWMRVPGDTTFFAGAVALVIFVFGLKTGRSFTRNGNTEESSE